VLLTLIYKSILVLGFSQSNAISKEKNPIFSSCHWHLQRQVCAVFNTTLWIIYIGKGYAIMPVTATVIALATLGVAT
jgi:hypothetical protein